MSKSGKVEIISEGLIRKLFDESLQNKRRRINYNLHNPEDPYQRFINVINTDSYMRPHKHQTGDDETFIILQGACLVLIFGDLGNIKAAHLLNTARGNYCADIVAGVWHTLLALTDGTAVIEAKAGPYDPDTAKYFAPWAPEEGTEHSKMFLTALFQSAVVKACLQTFEF